MVKNGMTLYTVVTSIGIRWLKLYLGKDKNKVYLDTDKDKKK